MRVYYYGDVCVYVFTEDESEDAYVVVVVVVVVEFFTTNHCVSWRHSPSWTRIVALLSDLVLLAFCLFPDFATIFGHQPDTHLRRFPVLQHEIQRVSWVVRVAVACLGCTCTPAMPVASIHAVVIHAYLKLQQRMAWVCRVLWYGCGWAFLALNCGI